MHLTPAISIGVYCPLPLSMTDSGMMAVESQIPLRLIGINGGTNVSELMDMRRKGLLVGVICYTQPHLTAISTHGADYVVPVGLNHKQVHHDIRCLFVPSTDINLTQPVDNTLQQMHTELNQTLDTYQTVEKSHGRIETRTLTASTALNDYIQ